MKKFVIPIIVAAVIAAGIGVYFILQKQQINSFDRCAKAGYPILQTAPRQCKAPDGKTFRESVFLKKLLVKLRPLVFSSKNGKNLALLAQGEQKPVYIYLYTHTEDHINHALSEERFERILPMIENYRNTYPQYNLSLTIEPYGADSEVDLQRLAGITCGVHKIIEPKKDIVNFLKGYKNRGVVEFGYHGAHEPTYVNNPFTKMNPPYQYATWQQISAAADQFLSWRRDLLYGFDPPAHPANPTISGGLKKTQEVFGQAAVLSGIKDDAAVVNMTEKYTNAKVMFGFIEHLTGSPIGTDDAYFNDIKTVASLLSPMSNNPPEIFWMENKLRTSDTDGSYQRRLVASDNLTVTRAFLANLDRSRPHVIHMQVADKGIYGAEPTLWAYNNPLSPNLPSTQIKSQAERDQKYLNTQLSIDYLVNEFFPVNPGSRFVSNADLTTMFGSSNFKYISKSELTSAADNLLANWQSGPPNFVVSSGGSYFSLTDMFQLLVNALADYRTNGVLSENTYLSKMYGPLQDNVPSSASFDVSVDSILSSSLSLQPKVNFISWSANPDYIVPSLVVVDNENINSAEFLYLMAKTYQTIAGGGGTILPVQLQPSSMWTEIGNIWKVNINKYSTTKFIGRYWTLKPAIVN